MKAKMKSKKVSHALNPAPFMSGYLPKKGGHEVFFQQFGNPLGEPVIAFHGGPGGAGKAKHIRMFNLKRHRIIIFDQRGCGQSKPTAGLINNSMRHTIDDACRLLKHLSVTQVTLYGGSWGSTIALAFAEAFPALVKDIIIAKTFLARQKDVDWIHTGAARLYADIYPLNNKSLSLRKYCANILQKGSPSELSRAAQLFLSYERQIGSIATQPGTLEKPKIEDINSFKIYMHFDSHNYFLKENALLDNISAISHIRILIVHNRMDVVCPIDQSVLLAQHMKKAKLVIVPDIGHHSLLLEKTLTKEISLFLRN